MPTQRTKFGWRLRLKRSKILPNISYTVTRKEAPTFLTGNILLDLYVVNNIRCWFLLSTLFVQSMMRQTNSWVSLTTSSLKPLMRRNVQSMHSVWLLTLKMTCTWSTWSTERRLTGSYTDSDMHWACTGTCTDEINGFSLLPKQLVLLHQEAPSDCQKAPNFRREAPGFRQKTTTFSQEDYLEIFCSV